MNETILNSITRTKFILNEYKDKNIAVSISGGADSDLLVDLCERCSPHQVRYVWFDTGIEYQATKDHLVYLEQKYGITIERVKAKIPVPLGNKKYGQPFLSKQASEYIGRLQAHNFKWEDRPFDELYKEYPKCKSALIWWCNVHGNGSCFTITRNTWLKEFMIKNPPTFNISPKCCDGSKKKPAMQYVKENKIDLMLIGLRRAEGVNRAANFKNDFELSHGIQYFRPILFYSDSDKAEYEETFGIVHSKCYTEYGLRRSGCAGCPYGRDCDFEREILMKYEPKLYKAVDNIFKESYEYTLKYKEFQRIMNLKYKKKKVCECGCTEFTGDDVAMNLKFYGRQTTKLLCKDCFMKNNNMSEEDWNCAIDGFKAQGCELF